MGDYSMGSRFRLFPIAPLPPPRKKEYNLMPEPPDTEFRKDFPPDATIGSELDDAARVWKVYRKEAEAFDKERLEGWSDTLEILLIFAALFSAVATAFVIESYQFLQLDNTAYSAAALYILVTHATGVTLPPPPDLSYGSSLSRWINGLWFTSILLSLAVSLLSILARQWITQYRARNNASTKNPKDWVLRREVYFQALESWHIADVIAFLPFLLHLSLFLFFAGVVAFLWALDKAIGIWIIVLGGSLCVFYIACTLIPLWVPQCPTSTPLSKQMRTSALALILTGLTAIIAASHVVQGTKSSILAHVRNLSSRPGLLHLADALAVITRRFGWTHIAHTADSTQSRGIRDRHCVPDVVLAGYLETAVERLKVIRGDTSGIRHHLQRDCNKLEAAALYWLIVEVSDSDAVAVGLQALGALDWNSPVAEVLRYYDQIVHFPEEIAFTRSSSDYTSTEVLRVVRSALCTSGNRGISPLRFRRSTAGRA